LCLLQSHGSHLSSATISAKFSAVNFSTSVVHNIFLPYSHHDTKTSMATSSQRASGPGGYAGSKPALGRPVSEKKKAVPEPMLTRSEQISAEQPISNEIRRLRLTVRLLILDVFDPRSYSYQNTSHRRCTRYDSSFPPIAFFFFLKKNLLIAVLA
jgi:hypothetical protein